MKMYPSPDGLPTPITTMDNLFGGTDNSARPEKVFVGHNLGSRSFLALIPMKDFFSMSKVANERQEDGSPASQRPLDEAHATKLAIYVLKGLVASASEYRRNFNKPPSAELELIKEQMGPQVYLSMQPLVANLRTCSPGGSDINGQRMEVAGETACFKIFLNQRDMLYVVDGQHRRYAMDLVFEFLDEVRLNRKYPKKPKLFAHDSKDVISSAMLAAWEECDEVARSFCRVAVEIHLGLGVKQEQQLFHDLNNLAKKIEKSLALRFDSANPINRFIQTDLLRDILQWDDVVDGDQTDWHDDTGRWTFKDLAAMNAILFLNKTNIANAVPADVDGKRDVALRVWEAISSVPGFGEKGARTRTVMAQPVMAKAVAKIAYDLAFSRRREATADANLERLLVNLSSVDFSHTNPCWRYYEMTEQARIDNKLSGLKDFLPADDGSNRDIGRYDPATNWMRFGSKHNDIFPILGDMIRWQLGLPGRHTRADELLSGLGTV
jgi:hypothetical protein